MLAVAVALAFAPSASAAPPANDDFAKARAIPQLPFTTSVDLRQATGARDDPGCARARTVWYAFTPEENMRLSAAVSGGRWEWVILGVFSGSRGALDRVLCEGDEKRLETRFSVVGGTTYYFLLGAEHPDGAGVRSFSLERIPPVGGDEIGNPNIVSTLPFTETVDANPATRAPTDPTCGAGSTVWYAFTPPSDMRLDVAARTSSGSLLGVYAGSPGGETELVCDDEGWRGFRFHATGGTTYYFLVAERWPSSTDVRDLTFSLRAAPRLATNDDFDSATVIDELPFADATDTRQAATAPDDPSSACGPRDRSVWYAFTAPRDMRVVAETAGSTYDTVLSVYTGARGALELVVCNDDSATTEAVAAKVQFNAQAGTTYYFMVASDFDAGDLAFSIRLPNSLTLTPSRAAVEYGASVRLSGHLEAFGDTANRRITIYATPYRGRPAPVARATVDGRGDFAVAVRPRKKTTYVARWTGDDRYPEIASRGRVVNVRPIAMLRLFGNYGISGRYRLYHAGVDPRMVAKVAPRHVGHRVTLILQPNVGGRWLEPASVNFRLDARSSAVVFLDNPPVGWTFRVRAFFAGDGDHARDFSRWVYLRVTR